MRCWLSKVHDVCQLKLPRGQPWHVLLIDEIHPARGDGLVLARPRVGSCHVFWAPGEVGITDHVGALKRYAKNLRMGFCWGESNYSSCTYITT